MRGRPVALTDFSGGLNLRDDPFALELNESAAAVDFIPQGRVIEMRRGDQVFADLSTPASLGVGPMFGSRTLNAIMFGLANNAIIRVSSTGIVTVVRAADAQPFVRPSFAEAPEAGGTGPVYFVASDGLGGQAGYGYDGAAVTTGVLGKYRLLAYVGGRLWGAKPRGSGTLDEFAELDWSDLYTPAAGFPADNTNLFDPRDGDEITAIGAVGSGLAVFKRRKAWLVYDLDTGANRPLGKGVGHLLNVEVCETPYGLVFADPDQGIMLTDGANVTDIGYRLGSTLQAAGENLSLAYLDESLFVSVTNTDDLYEYRFREKTWWKHSADVSYLLAFAFTGQAAGTLYGLRRTTFRLDRLMVAGRTLKANNTAMAPTWRTPFLDLGTPGVRKRIRAVEVMGRGAATLTAYRDSDLTAPLASAGTKVLGDASTEQSGTAKFPTLGVGDSLALQLDMAVSSGQVPQLGQIVVWGDQRAD